MSKKPGTPGTASEKLVWDIRRTTRKQYSAEEKIRRSGRSSRWSGSGKSR